MTDPPEAQEHSISQEYGYYDPSPYGIYALICFVALIGAGFVVNFLDETQIQFVGYLLYPIDWAGGALFVPHSEPHFLRNGTALVVLFANAIFFYLLFYLARLVFGLVHGALSLIPRAYAYCLPIARFVTRRQT